MKTPAKPTEERCEHGGETRLRLPAFEDADLSDEAVQQLIALDQAPNLCGHKGKDLPSVTRADLLNQLEKGR